MMTEQTSTLGPAAIVWHWESLRKMVCDAEQVLELRDSPLVDVFWLGLTTEGLPAALIGIQPDEKIPSDLSGRNIQVKARTICLSGKARRVVELSCADNALEMPFSELVAGVYRRLIGGRSGRLAVAGALAEFRELLEQRRGLAASREEAAGLAGELLVLKRLLALNSGAWKAWEGPLGGAWDFKAGGQALEVKTSTCPGEPAVHINGIHQLESPDDGLHLIHLTLLPDAAGPVSVPGLVRDVLDALGDPEGFRERLEKIGYSEANAERWADHRFDVQGHAIFSVTDNFPRLIPEMLKEGRLPVGVDQVSYSVRLDVARKWLVPDTAEDGVYRDFIHELS